jgi:CheY-like chemotaxis protein
LSSTFVARNDICLADHPGAPACLKKHHHVWPLVPARKSPVTDVPQLTHLPSGTHLAFTSDQLKMWAVVTMHIYLITEAPILAATVGDHLGGMGYIVTSFRDTDEAFAAHVSSTQSCDALLVDVAGPDHVARTVLNSLHDGLPGIPIIVMLTNGTTLTSEAALSLGVHAYLRKPISLSELELALLRLPVGREVAEVVSTF